MYKVSRVIALFTFAAMILVPSLIVVLGSFKTDAEVYNKPLSLPETWSLGNYSDLDVSFRNSVFVTVSSVVLTLILASLASFAIARMITVSGKVLAGLFALGLAIPAQINLVPIYYIFRDLGLTNSYIGLILINVTTTLPISIFILSAFFRHHHCEFIVQLRFRSQGRRWVRQQYSCLLSTGMICCGHSC
jgi:raffinose/stachyose/melibiose transport system permease protein